MHWSRPLRLSLTATLVVALAAACTPDGNPTGVGGRLKASKAPEATGASAGPASQAPPVVTGSVDPNGKTPAPSTAPSALASTPGDSCPARWRPVCRRLCAT